MSGVRECSVCWTVYDPAVGDPIRQIPAGTDFEALPDDWRCPTCDAEKEKFVRPEASAEGREVSSLRDAYEAVAKRMVGLPIVNPKLQVALVGFRPFANGQAGVVVTPWFMNVVVVPPKGEAPRVSGASVSRTFPSGTVELMVGHLEGVGPIETASLFSPMHEFRDAAQAEAVALEAVEALFAPPVPVETPAPPSTRRELFRRALAR